MSEAVAMQSKDEKEYAVRQCWGRCLNYSWQIAAAGRMIRNITESEMDNRQDTEIVLCNGLMAANSLIMTDLDELQDLLDIPLPDWGAIKKNQPGGMDLANALQ